MLSFIYILGWSNFQLLIGVRKDEPVVTQDIVKGKDLFRVHIRLESQVIVVFGYQQIAHLRIIIKP